MENSAPAVDGGCTGSAELSHGTPGKSSPSRTWTTGRQGLEPEKLE